MVKLKLKKFMNKTEARSNDIRIIFPRKMTMSDSVKRNPDTSKRAV